MGNERENMADFSKMLKALPNMGMTSAQERLYDRIDEQRANMDFGTTRIVVTRVQLRGDPDGIRYWEMEYTSAGPPPVELGEYELVKVLDAGDRLFKENKQLTKQNQKLQQRLNRITNLMIGNERIWELDRLAMEQEVEAELLSKEWTLNVYVPLAQVSRREALVRYGNLQADALFLRRLEWDLGELHVAIKGDTARRGGRYDQSEWRGSRP